MSKIFFLLDWEVEASFTEHEWKNGDIPGVNFYMNSFRSWISILISVHERITC